MIRAKIYGLGKADSSRNSKLSTPKLITFILLLGLFSCQSNIPHPSSEDSETYPDVQIVGAMKNVMWKGELGPQVALDTLSKLEGLYGLGPLSYLRGELLVTNGKSYISTVASDTSMIVEESFRAGAPFFVYAQVNEWTEVELPAELKTIPDLEKFIEAQSTSLKRPFAFKLEGAVASARIHIQNLPPGSQVSSPKEAHQGQTDYHLENESVEIIGFFSTEHQGIFTHHDSYLHMHLISEDELKMGHLDAMEIQDLKLYLPRK